MNVYDYLKSLPPEYAERVREFFSYGVDFTGTNQLPGGGSQSRTFSIQQDSDFLLTTINFRANEDGTPEDAVDRPGITLQLSDTGSGRNVFARALALDTVAGLGSDSFHLPWFFFLNRGSTVDVTVNNLVAATDFDVRISFIGVKLFVSRQGV